MRRLTEAEALALLQRGKAAFQTHVKLNFEHRARDCRACPTPGVCCTDAHFVNVHITRLEAVAVRETVRRIVSRIATASSRVMWTFTKCASVQHAPGVGHARQSTARCSKFSLTWVWKAALPR